MSEKVEAFVISAPGIEPITLDELRLLGVKDARLERGGITFQGRMESVYAANLWLRSASRVLVRAARFHADSFSELERRAKTIPWENFLPEGGDAEAVFRVTCRKSRLYHSDAVAERLMLAAARSGIRVRLAAKDAPADPDSEAPASGSQLFVVRLDHDELTISADSSGDLLHRRGYRLEATRAPLRETLAAAMILSSGWKPGNPLLDPLCGSGTIPIEAAMIANNVAPGHRRKFAFEQWPSFDSALWNGLREDAHGTGAMAAASILGADRDAGAIQIAARNAERAGVSPNVEFVQQSLSASLQDLESTSESNFVLTNPPYGVRVTGGATLRDLYSTLGNAFKKHREWKLGILTSDQKLVRAAGIRAEPVFRTQNGGIPVTFFVSK